VLPLSNSDDLLEETGAYLLLDGLDPGRKGYMLAGWRARNKPYESAEAGLTGRQ
jgi:hypothetical protein